MLKDLQSPIFLCHQPIDMRKSIDGLAALVATVYDTPPTSGAWYVFCNRSKDKIKILYWDRNGFCLWYKRLEKDRFRIVYGGSGPVELEAYQLRWLLDGLNYTQIQGHQKLNYSLFY